MMRIVGRSFLFLSLVAALLLMTTPVMAQSNNRPGSILIFPLVDSTPGAGTIVCVTNTNTERQYCPETDFLAGDVLLHYLYIDGDTWREFDRYELLTPGDTLCVLADEHNSEMGRGFLVVSARNPSDSTLLGFDHLIGSATIAQSEVSFLWSYLAYPFDTEIKVIDCGDLENPDADGDGVPDYDGDEYQQFPETLYIDSFFQEDGPHNFINQLTLMSTSGSVYTNEVSILIWNNEETKYSRTLNFVCWFSGALSEISPIVLNLGGDANEFGHQTQTGWVSLKGSRILDASGNPVKQEDDTTNAKPAMLGVFMQGIDNTNFTMGRNIHFEGFLDGGEIEIGNGDPQQMVH